MSFAVVRSATRQLRELAASRLRRSGSAQFLAGSLARALLEPFGFDFEGPDRSRAAVRALPRDAEPPVDRQRDPQPTLLIVASSQTQPGAKSPLGTEVSPAVSRKVLNLRARLILGS